MRTAIRFLIISLLASAGVLGAGTNVDPQNARVSGTYLEVRTSDVWTGPCFANGEVNLVGKEGLMAWDVEAGEWNGVRLDGLKVVAVLRANHTLGDPFARDPAARALLVVDSRASEAQSDALISLARALGGELLEEVVSVQRASIDLTVVKNSGAASLKAGDFLEVQTRGLNHHDMHCGNEFVYYPPLSPTTSAEPAYALAHRFDGAGLGASWSSPGKRSAFIGTFSR